MQDARYIVVVSADGSTEHASPGLPFDPRGLAGPTARHHVGEGDGSLTVAGWTGTAARLVGDDGVVRYCWSFARADAPPELTRHQRRVAELAARGRRNREIAADLGVAPETVKQHLDAAYARLDVASRVELRRRLLGR